MSHSFRKALATASTATSHAAKIPTATEPTGDGVHDLRGMENKKLAMLIPFGTDGDNDTFEVRMYGWALEPSSGVWVPFLIVDLAVVLGSISGAALGTGNFMPDTLTLNEGIPAGPFSGLNSTAEDTTSFIVVHLMGAQKIEFTFDLVGAQEAVSMNCLWKPLDY